MAYRVKIQTCSSALSAKDENIKPLLAQSLTETISTVPEIINILFPNWPSEALESALLYDGNQPNHFNKSVHSRFPIKIYYIQLPNSIQSADSHRLEQVLSKKTNYVIIRSNESFADYQKKWQAALEQKIQAVKAAKAAEKPAKESEVTCPLSRDIFVDPVKLPSGAVVERKLINDWIATKEGAAIGECPVRKQQFSSAVTLETIAGLKTDKQTLEKVKAFYKTYPEECLEVSFASVSFTKSRSAFIAWEDFINPSHFILAAFFLFAISFLAPAALLTSAASLASLALLPALIIYIGVKIYKDAQAFNDEHWNSKIDALQINIEQPLALWKDPLKAQATMEVNGRILELKDSSAGAVFAYTKALFIRLGVWVIHHPYQAAFVIVGMITVAVVMTLAIFGLGGAIDPLGFISGLWINGIHDIIAWFPDQLAFLSVMSTGTVAQIIASVIFVVGGVSLIDNIRRLGSAIYTAWPAREQVDHQGLQDAKHWDEMDPDPVKNPVAASYTHTIGWLSAPIFQEYTEACQVSSGKGNTIS